MGAKTLALTLADFQWMSWYFFVVVYVSFFPVKIVHRNFRLFVLDITASPWLTLNFKIFEWFLRPFNAINKHERKNKLLLCIKWDCISIFHSGLLTYISTIMKFVRRYCRIRPFYFLKQRNHISEWVFLILRWRTDFNGLLWYHHFLYIMIISSNNMTHICHLFIFIPRRWERNRQMEGNFNSLLTIR